MKRREFVMSVAAGIAAGSQIVGAAQAPQASSPESWPDQARARKLHWVPGISTCFARPNRFEPAKHLPMVATAGFKCIELNCSAGSADFLWDQPRAIRELMKVADDTGVAVYSLHALGEWLPAAARFERRKYIDLARACLFNSDFGSAADWTILDEFRDNVLALGVGPQSLERLLSTNVARLLRLEARP